MTQENKIKIIVSSVASVTLALCLVVLLSHSQPGGDGKETSSNFKKTKTVFKEVKSTGASTIIAADNTRTSENSLADLEKNNKKSLLGHLTEANMKLRSDYYSKRDFELATRHLDEVNDPVENVVSEFESTIDFSLGTDFPEKRRVPIRGLQREMLYQKEALDSESIDEKLYLSQLNDIYNDYLSKMAGLLSSEEFYLLFQVERHDFRDAVLKIASLPEPENNED